jgi:hypothetical protein
VPCNSRVETDPGWAIFNGFIATRREIETYWKDENKKK